MSLLIYLLMLTALLWTLFYFRIPLLVGSTVVAATLIIWPQIVHFSAVTQSITWIVFLIIAVPLNIKPLRRTLISNRLLAWFRKIMPSMSQTEREALNAGNVWWDGELFSGKPQWQMLLNTPAPILSPEEKAFIEGPVEDLCHLIDDWRTTQHDFDLAPEVWQFIKEKGFLGMIIPKRYGGLAFSAQAHSAVVTKVAGRSITAAVTIMVPNSLGPAELLLRYGTEAQKERYLHRLAKGDELPCFALTSPEAGSDAAAMTDTGIICKDEFNGEKDVLGIRLNWEKRYITLGPVATVLGLAFKLYDPEHLLGDKEDLGITCALIPTDTPGVEIGKRHFPLNSAFQNGPNSGKDVFIPIDWIIGGQQQAGHGWRMLMECLAAGRSISLPALSTGAGKLISRATGAYAHVRKQFKTSIGRFEGVEEVLARIGGTSYMMDAARSLTATAIDQGESPSVVSAIVKYNLTEAMRRVVTDAMDIHGGSGICLGPRNFLGRVYQSIPISITVEGANILTRSLIIFGQGAIRCHPYVLKELEAAKESDFDKASRDFDQAFFAHVGFTISNALRSLFLGLTGARFVKAPEQGPSAVYYRHLTRFSSAFAFVSDIAILVLGGDLKRKEKLTGRLADVLSHLYLTSAVLKRYYDQRDDQAQQHDDLPLLRWWCDHSLHEMQLNLDRFLINFPIRPIAWLVRRIVFPLGKSFSEPSDTLGHAVASILLNPSATRDRLTQGIFLPNDESSREKEPLARLEHALKCMIEATPAEKKLRAALQSGKIKSYHRDQQIKAAFAADFIDQNDVDLLSNADRAQQEALRVDEFDPFEFGQKTTAPYFTRETRETG
ncbi:MAG: acyl-CoA dehydrogenase [Gammaproteobacteria bacterium]|nr:acyl-CoA dehydrogenase [Gammaproteobacteria bacterium]